MGKVAGTETVVRSPEVFFCPFQSSASVPVYCSRECALHVLKRRIFGGKVVFNGCCLKWLAIQGEFE